MDTTQLDIIGHPLFIVLVAAAFTAIGGLLTMLFNNRADHAEFRQAILDLRQMVIDNKWERDADKAAADEHKAQFDRLKGQHDMVINAGNIVRAHASGT